MRTSARLLTSILLASSLCAAHAGAPTAEGAATSPSAASETGDRFIVRLRDRSADPAKGLAQIGSAFGERLDHLRPMSGDAHVVRLGRRLMRGEAREVAQRLARDPRIASIEPDLLIRPMAVPNDTMYGQQWHYYEAAGGINLPAAWDITTGSAGVTVAVIDTGVRPHADLAARLVGGYDFVGDTSMSNDGNGRDPDATDPGDYGCDGSASSWHGTHVAGTIGAVSNNGNGVAGINWASRILPVRVLGRCGGYTSDIADGMRWAAGIAVPGVPANPYPARVENLSLGGDGTCSSTFQNAINDVVARGTVVVVAAGNGGSDAANTEPAGCSGVIAVGATTRNGGRAGYSNYGARLTLSAPGGGNGDGVLSTANSGATTPGADSYAWYAGTSMATPHVSGVVSLMLSVDSSLTPAQVADRLRRSARAFPSGTGADCNPSLCGAGIVDAGATLAALAAPPAAPPASGWSRIADEGQDFSVDGTRSVRYGSGSTWITRTVVNGGSCTNGWFGTDPLVGTFKHCEVATDAVQTGWTTIAVEGQGFALAGTQTVRYGSDPYWVTATVSGGGFCSNGFFGMDPLFGVVKHCEAAGSAGGTTWTRIAGEGQTFGVGGTQTVRYGSGSSWVTRSVSNGGTCSNEYFGSDPLYGVVKQCEVAS